MKQRYLYAFIFGIPGMLISAFIAIFASAFIQGLFTFFIFGIDNNQPFWTEWVIGTIGATIFLIVLYFIARRGFYIGTKREFEKAPVNNKHIVIAITTLVLLVFLMIIFQRGYIFEKPPYEVCRDLCIQKGYDGSFTSLGPKVSGKRTCSCWNNTTKQDDEVGSVSVD